MGGFVAVGWLGWIFSFIFVFLHFQGLLILGGVRGLSPLKPGSNGIPSTPRNVSTNLYLGVKKTGTDVVLFLCSGVSPGQLDELCWLSDPTQKRFTISSAWVKLEIEGWGKVPPGVGVGSRRGGWFGSKIFLALQNYGPSCGLKRLLIELQPFHLYTYQIAEWVLAGRERTFHGKV